MGAKEAKVCAKEAVKETKEAIQGETKVSQAPSVNLQPQNTTMAPFPFSPFMPNQSFFPMSLVNNGLPTSDTNNTEGGTTMMWQTMYGAAMTTQRK